MTAAETPVRVVLVTAPDEETAAGLARTVVGERLAACANLVPGVRSLYRWEGAVQDDAEVLLVIKTTASGYQGVENWLGANHPYDVPEVVALPAEKVAGPYLAWMESCVGT